MHYYKSKATDNHQLYHVGGNLSALQILREFKQSATRIFLSDVIVGQNDDANDDASDDANDGTQQSIQSNVTNTGQGKYITCDSKNKENDR